MPKERATHDHTHQIDDYVAMAEFIDEPERLVHEHEVVEEVSASSQEVVLAGLQPSPRQAMVGSHAHAHVQVRVNLARA